MKNLLLCVLFYILCQSIVIGRGFDDIAFSKITPKGGVAYSSVMCIGQDDLGLIWFGTNNGLFKYDSKNIVRYATNSEDSLSIPTNRINHFYLDHSNNFWIATENGLCRYNRKCDGFERLKLTNSQNKNIGLDIKSFFQDSKDQFWIVNEVGVCRLDTALSRIEYVSFEGKDIRINRGFSDISKNLWFTSYSGHIYRYNKISQNIELFHNGLEDPPRTILVDGNDVWIGYENKGLICVDLSSKELKYYYSEEKEISNHLSSSKVRALTKDQNGNIWVATYNGINIIKDYTYKACLSGEDMYNIPHHSIWSFFKDLENNIWVGTWLGGLCLYDQYMNAVYHYHKSFLFSKLKDDVISCFAEDNCNIWIGTESGGMYCLNTQSDELTHVCLSEQLSEANIKSIAIDKHNSIWVGTYGKGIWVKSGNDNAFRKIESPYNIGWQILDIKPTEKGVWFANYSEGALFYSFETKRTTNYKHNSLDLYTITNDFVRNIIQDRKGNIWLATVSGLNKYVPSEDKFYHYFKEENNSNSLSNNFIYSIFEDERGIIWIGTNGNGLNKLDPKNNVFEVYTMNDGLSGNEIYSIVCDDDGLLWMSTENGITSFNSVTLETRNMVSEAGIYNNQFNPTAGFKSYSGELFFGGSNGFIRFVPDRIKINPVKPRAVISHFSINNREVSSNLPNSVLNNHISKTKSILLKHDQNSFSFDFVATNYLFPQKNKFRYHLLGFDTEWLETDYAGKAIYTNIPPGNYAFEVLAANNDGVWNDVPAKVSIKILPPHWKRWYAFLLYLIVIVALTYLIRTEIISKEKLKNEVTIEKIQLENEKRISQLKLQFFTNVSHEFRTPLTLILGPVERLLKSYAAEDNLTKQLTIVSNNATRLLRLVTQIIDFRKVETGNMDIDLQEVEIIEFCAEIYNNFKEQAHHKQIHYSFDAGLDHLRLTLDKDKVDKVLFNLLSNAFKYTSESGNVKFVVKKNSSLISDGQSNNSYTIGEDIKGDFIEVSIKDSGCGIPNQELKKVFDRFYGGKDGKYDSVGIGLALTRELVIMLGGKLIVVSELNKGSVFSVQFPVIHQIKQNDKKAERLVGQINSQTQEDDFKREGDLNNLEETLKNKDSLVLIVEDNDELREYIGDVLSPYFRIAKAKDGIQGVEHAQTVFPDVIVSDIMMPGMNGCELCQNLKEDIKTSHIPIILLTALNSVEDNLIGLRIGADAYISKPFTEELLIVQIDNLIESRKKLSESFSSGNILWYENIDGLSLDKKLIQKAIAIVNQNLQEESFTVESLATEIGLSRTHLHRKLKSITNQSASEFIRNIRLERAKELMARGELKINEIGYAVGFNSHTYFTKSFRKYVGVSPQEYLKNKG